MSAVAEKPVEEVEQTQAAPVEQSEPERETEQEHYEKILRKEKYCEELEQEFRQLQHDAKEAKEAWQASVGDLRRSIRRGPAIKMPAQLPLPMDSESLDDHEKKLAEPITKVLKLTNKQTEKLEDLGVKTVGDFENLRAGKFKDYPGGLIDVNGIGEATITKWEDQIIDFLQQSDESDDG